MDGSFASCHSYLSGSRGQRSTSFVLITFEEIKVCALKSISLSEINGELTI
jgi:hypothetical protein